MTDSLFFWLPAAYLLGSVPTGYLMGRALKGIDIREHGSGNPGATNVFRVVGRGPGVVTLLLDAFKGFLPVEAAMRVAPDSLWKIALIGLAAIAGHNWSLFLRFRGGKGVATSTGVFLALLPKPTLIAFAVFLAGFLSTGHVSLGSMAGAVSLIFSVWFFTRSPFLTALALFCALLILYLHKKNIRRLLNRQEHKITLFGDQK